MLNLGQTFPNFSANTTAGDIAFHEWMDGSWCVFLSQPGNFMSVCTTELARLYQLNSEFIKRNTKIIVLTCDSIQDHNVWSYDIIKYSNQSDHSVPFPIIADVTREISAQLQILDSSETDGQGVPVTSRAQFIIDPSKKLRLSAIYPATTGRNFDETLRALDSLQLCDKYKAHKIATPIEWTPGEDVAIPPSMPKEDAKDLTSFLTLFVLPSGKSYMRTIELPSLE